MIARDGPFCVVPGCPVPIEETQAHHLTDYSQGGLTNLADGGHICDGNHNDIHLGGAKLIRGPDGWEFTAPYGIVYRDADYR